MELRQLRYAVAVAEHRNFGRAAAALGIAQPPLSRQVAALEREIGTALFERTARGAVPTAAGAVFAEHARRVLEQAGHGAEQARRAARGESGSLRIGFIGSALVELLPSLLARFRAAHPAVELELRELSSAGGTAELAGGRIDLSVTRGAPRGPGAERLTALPVGHDRLVVVAARAHPFAGQGRIAREQLRGRALVAAPAGEEPATVSAVAEILDGSPVTRARDVHTIVGLAACGIGLGLLPSSARSLNRRDTVMLEVDPPLPLPDLSLAFRTGDDSPVLAAFLAVTAVHCPGTGERLARLGRPVPDPPPTPAGTPGRR